MILDLDVGNTRVKWLLRNLTGGVERRGAFLCRDWPGEKKDIWSFGPDVRRVRMASVAGGITETLQEFFQNNWRLNPEIASLVDGAGGLKCGYLQPAKLGIDRWLAMAAAWSSCQDNLLVVDAGSALTIDAVDAGGVHLGGYILPGIEMMKKALVGNTAAVRVEGGMHLALEPGRSTVEAVGHGALLGLVGAVDMATKLATRQKPVAKIFLTGGDSQLLKQYLDTATAVEEKPDLVLDGLAIVLP